MDYEYQIFLSYRPSQTMGRWVERRRMPLLEDRLGEEAPTTIRICWDHNIEAGTLWPSEGCSNCWCGRLACESIPAPIIGGLVFAFGPT